ncbi:MAG: hypothetical protein KDC61_10150 [Saprospiraceae bacterium]|nr:hypothetical protein [Saprospiraceae bacterium]MCB0574912.1 hypothetical protein [Saprospiraceae bacterium]
MEDQNQPLDAGMDSGSPESKLQITSSVRSDWDEIAKWAMFFAVLLFIVLGLVVLMSLFVAFAGNMGIVMAIIMLGLYGTLLFFPAWYYYKFSTQTRQALREENTPALDEGFWNLKRYYRFVGILYIVVISLYVLFLLIALATGGMAGMMGR